MIMQKLTTIVRGSIRESAEGIIDANAIRVFEQEIYDCEMRIRTAKANLTVVEAEKIKLKRQISNCEKTIRDREEQAIEAFKKDLTDLAEKLANLIAEEEKVQESFSFNLKKLEKQEQLLTQKLKEAINKIKGYRRELELAKATHLSQEAYDSLHGQYESISITGDSLENSLDRVRNKQQDFLDRQEAMQKVEEKLGRGHIDEVLRDHDINKDHRAEKVMQRIKARVGK